MDVQFYFGVFLFVGFLLLIYFLFLRSGKKFQEKDLKFFRQEWGKICHHEDGKHAVLDADKLLQIVLRKKGYQGNVGEQLKKSAKLFSNLNDVWTAHKLRNRVAHELDVRISSGDRQLALRAYERALKDLGAL